MCITIVYCLPSHTFLPLDPPNVTLSPINDITVNETDTLSLICTVFGIPPPNIQWSMTTVSDESSISQLLSTDDSYRITLTDIPHDVFIGSHFISSNLTILRIAKDQEGYYTCAATNGVTNLIGSVQNDTVYITVQGTYFSDYLFYLILTQFLHWFVL